MGKSEEEILREIMRELEKMGSKCGRVIARVVGRMHPNAYVVPLYRSAIAVEPVKISEYSQVAVIHFYGDPHWLGHDRITAGLLRKTAFHSFAVISGSRIMPDILFFDIEYGTPYVARLSPEDAVCTLKAGLKKEYRDYVLRKVKPSKLRELVRKLIGGKYQFKPRRKI